MSSVDISYSPRGFALFGDDVKTAEEFRMRVQESSSAEKEAAWLFIANDDGVDVAVHMTVEQTKMLAASLHAGNGPQVRTDYGHMVQVLPQAGHNALIVTKGASEFPGDPEACDVRMRLSDSEADELEERLHTYIEFVTP